MVTGESNEDVAATKDRLASAYAANLLPGVKEELAVNDRHGESPAAAEGRKSKQWSNSWWTQASVLWTRGIKERRHEHLSPFSIVQVAAVSVISGLLWWRTDASRLQDKVGLLFFAATFWGFSTLFQAVFTFPQERNMLQKERASGMYRLSSYFVALCLSDLPISLLLPAAFFTVVYWMAGLKASAARFFAGLLVLLASCVCTQGLGLAVGALVLHQRSATVLASVVMSSFTLVGGYYVTHVPKFIRWIRYLSSIQHTFKLLLVTQFAADETYPCGGNRVCRVADFPTVKPVGLEGGVAESVVAIAVMIVGYRLIAYFALRRIGTPRK